MCVMQSCQGLDTVENDVSPPIGHVLTFSFVLATYIF